MGAMALANGAGSEDGTERCRRLEAAGANSDVAASRTGSCTTVVAVAASALFAAVLVQQCVWERRTLHRFTNDAVIVDIATGTRLLHGWRGGRRVGLELRRTAGAGVGVFVSAGHHLEVGELAGCFGGAVGTREAMLMKQQRAEADGFDAYIFSLNETHFVDPTSARGRMDDTQPPWREPMALVNEPSTGAPNVSPLIGGYGACRTRIGNTPGVPMLSIRRIAADEQLYVCSV
jgi:hypothetical protein